ncbi:MAG: HEAT repeat domain-containing protein [Myxococcales bacterium]|nr:HEAT repeat domain-containing protein [Myxococcales bacterium]
MNKRMVFSLILVLSMAHLSLVSLTYAQSVTDLQSERLLALLRKPVDETTRLDWQRVGPDKDTNELLVQVAMNKDQPIVFRGRAIQAMAYFPTKRTHQFLWQATYERDLDNRLKKAALRSLGAAFQHEALFELSAFLTDSSAVIREGAVRGLGLIRDGRARTILENHLDKEENLDVRLATDEALRQVQRWEASQSRRLSAETLDGLPHIGPEELLPLETESAPNTE